MVRVCVCVGVKWGQRDKNGQINKERERARGEDRRKKRTRQDMCVVKSGSCC